MPESASRRHRRRPAGGPCARLAAIVLVLTAVAAGPGGAELAVVVASSAAAGLVGLALAAPGLVGAGRHRTRPALRHLEPLPGAALPRPGDGPGSPAPLSADSLGVALSNSASASSFLSRAFWACDSLSRLASAALVPAWARRHRCRVDPVISTMPQHPSRVAAPAEHPLSLTNLANPPALWRRPSPLRCGHRCIVGGSDPQHADSNQRPTSDALTATQEPKI